MIIKRKTSFLGALCFLRFLHPNITGQLPGTEFVCPLDRNVTSCQSYGQGIGPHRSYKQQETPGFITPGALLLNQKQWRGSQVTWIFHTAQMN